jgi:hypothetical protein
VEDRPKFPFLLQVDGLEIIPFYMSVDDPTFQIMVLSRLIPHMNNSHLSLLLGLISSRIMTGEKEIPTLTHR